MSAAHRWARPRIRNCHRLPRPVSVFRGRIRRERRGQPHDTAPSLVSPIRSDTPIFGWCRGRSRPTVGVREVMFGASRDCERHTVLPTSIFDHLHGVRGTTLDFQHVQNPFKRSAAPDNRALVQGSVSQLTYWHLSDIDSTVTGLDGGTDDAIAGINPTWEDSSSEKRIIAFRVVGSTAASTTVQLTHSDSSRSNRESSTSVTTCPRISKTSFPSSTEVR